jgi:hypothetical protein
MEKPPQRVIPLQATEGGSFLSLSRHHFRGKFDFLWEEVMVTVGGTFLFMTLELSPMSVVIFCGFLFNPLSLMVGGESREPGTELVTLSI